MLTALQNAFVLEYPKDWDGKNAAMRVGVNENTAAQAAYRWLCNPAVVEAIEERKRDLAAAAGLSVEWVLRQWREVAEADPNELIYSQLECCRHCYGVAHNYQWTRFEYDQAVSAAQQHMCSPRCEQPCVKKMPPLPVGGFDFTPHQPPVNECPVCHGRGVERICLADTRRLRGPARRLYAGVKQTQYGVEMKMRDQDKARDNIAKYLGMLIDKRELAGPNGGTIPMAHFDAKDLTDDQLAQIIQQREGEA